MKKLADFIKKLAGRGALRAGKGAGAYRQPLSKIGGFELWLLYCI